MLYTRKSTADSKSSFDPNFINSDMSKQRKITTTTIRQKLHQYIETAQDKKVKAIFALIEEEIEESSDHWQDEAFIADLEKSEKAYLNGTAKLVSIDQAVAKARAAIKKVKNK